MITASQQFSITLPDDMAQAIERKVRSGAYASVSDVVREGVQALLERDITIERWLRDEVLPGHEEYLADPSKGVQRKPSSTVSRCDARHAAEYDIAGRIHSASRASG